MHFDSSSETMERPEESCEKQCQFKQNVIVMRHGDRMDNVEPLWASSAERPWDPPLVDAGRTRAFCTGRNLRNRLPFPITRAFVSPFLRCVQTAVEALSALHAVSDDDPLNNKSDAVQIDPSKIKVSIEYGLCEMMNKEAIRLPPEDQKWGFNISELESMFPAGIVDHSAEKIYAQLPKWEESLLSARTRYEQVILALADKFPQENLLLVTHGEGVGASVTAFMEDVTVYDVEYCAYSHLKRTIPSGENKPSTFGKFEVVREHQTGISFCPLSALTR